VGCGTGRHAMALSQREYETAELERSERMVRQARAVAHRHHLRVDLGVGDARSLPFRKAFEPVLILCEGGFSLVETGALDRHIVCGAARVLRRGGTLISTAPHVAFMCRMAHEPGEGYFDLVTLGESFEIDTMEDAVRTRTLKSRQRYHAWR